MDEPILMKFYSVVVYYKSMITLVQNISREIAARDGAIFL